MQQDIDGPHDIIARGRRYPAGTHLEAHRHARAQLLYGLTGTVLVEGPVGLWMMPPDSALWIPAQVPHEVTMIGDVNMRSLYLRPSLLKAMPDHCVVLGVSSLLRALLDALAGVEDGETKRRGLMCELALEEIVRQPVVSLSLPLPPDGAMRRECLRFREEPDAGSRIEDWCGALNMSRRNFTRQFRANVGLTFVEWRTRACVLTAISRLVAGEQVTRIAFDLGYYSAASFAAMFRRATGVQPSRYRRD